MMAQPNYSNLQDDSSFDEDLVDWPYRLVDGNAILYATEPIDDVEARAYIRRGRQYWRVPFTIFAVVDGDDVELHYRYGMRKFDRIRRITGYLVGTLDRFNDAKRAEENDRVKHGLA